MNSTFKVGIIGAGWIAEKAAITLAGMAGFQCYAIASRSQQKADAFARQWDVEKAYGSYSALLDDDQVDLVYVATPHSHHYDVTLEALEKGRACLVEKAFMANLQSAANCVGDNIGVLSGTDGNLILDNVNNPQKITVNTHDRVFVEEIHVPEQITGYEYQFYACRDAMQAGLLEPPQMPWEEILYIMQLMDGLRREWGVVYPMDGKDFQYFGG